jgi:thiol-disulfide isomerase/thioredoxin
MRVTFAKGNGTAMTQVYGKPATLAFALALYGMMSLPGNAQQATCSASEPVISRMKPLMKGEVAAVIAPDKGKAVPDLTFLGPGGAEVKLSSFRGKTVLLNLWATWCAPCRKEMPALNRLQAELGGADFEVVAISIDQRNLDRPKAFLAEIGVDKLTYFSDPKAKVFQDLKATSQAFGMPTTLIIDKNGCELGHLPGAAEWSSDDALALLKAAMGK